MTAEGRITTARLYDGAKILVNIDGQANLTLPTSQQGTVIATVKGKQPATGRGRWDVETDLGILSGVSGGQTHALATAKDVARIEREEKAADRAAEEVLRSGIVAGISTPEPDAEQLKITRLPGVERFGPNSGDNFAYLAKHADTETAREFWSGKLRAFKAA